MTQGLHSNHFCNLFACACFLLSSTAGSITTVLVAYSLILGSAPLLRWFMPICLRVALIPTIVDIADCIARSKLLSQSFVFNPRGWDGLLDPQSLGCWFIAWPEGWDFVTTMPCIAYRFWLWIPFWGCTIYLIPCCPATWAPRSDPGIFSKSRKFDWFSGLLPLRTGAKRREWGNDP